MHTSIMGWDIGGAHLKAACIEPKLGVINVYQQPCQLWKGLDKLQEAVCIILNQAAMAQGGLHVITMTGELVDLFASRDDGVEQILAAMGRFLPGKLIVYAGKDGLLTIAEIKALHYPAIASANWLASATWAAQKLGSGLFVDIGSTTTDILPLNGGEVLAEGYSDYERLVSGELVYTGIVRTPVMAVAQYVRDQGREVGLIAEHFATMADVYRITGELDESHDQCDTADGAEKTVAASARRLARMVGCDYDDHGLPRWQLVAENLRAEQTTKIQDACEQHLKRVESSACPPMLDPIIGAGIGRFLTKQIALNLGRPYVDFSGLCAGLDDQSEYDVADCAPAAAIACLAMVANN